MNKFKSMLIYFIIVILFVVTISIAIPVEVNAGDADDPYQDYII
ncbi:MAG: hypothetical protein WBL93_00915 [Lutisporaceae bacterium]